MPSYTFFIYSVNALSYNGVTRAFDFDADYQHWQDRYRVEVSDDDATMNSGGDANQIATIYDMDGNVVNSGSITVPRYAYVQDETGTLTYYFDRIVVNGTHYGYVSSGPLTPGSSYSVLESSTFADNHTYYQTNSTPCLVAGTLIETTVGPKAVEMLVQGDTVIGYSVKELAIQRILRRRFTVRDLHANPKLRPVRIVAGALGGGLPKRDLLVSPQHRMLVQSSIAERMFGETEVLVSAVKLTELPGIFIDETVEGVEYFHLLFGQHEVIYAEGAPTESFLTGPEALKSISAEAREEILTIFPEVAEIGYSPKSARFIPLGKQQKQLVARHLKNNQPLLRKASQPSHL